MVHYYRSHHQLKMGEGHQQHIEEYEALTFVCSNSGYYKRTTRLRKLLFLLVLSLFSCCLILTNHVLCPFSSFSLFNKLTFGAEYNEVASDMEASASFCSSVSNGAICCERSSIRSDICFMKGDVRTHSASSSIFLYASRRNSTTFSDYVLSIANPNEEHKHEKIKPYTRKWETSVMDTIEELQLIAKEENYVIDHHCDVKHNVPAVFFSTGGYTGNVYHEFNDGILPLYITSQHLNKKVRFVILEYHNWWFTKYENILSQLSDYAPIDFNGDERTHCFPEAIVGLRIHDELAVDPSLMQGNKSIIDFRNLLDRAYKPRINSLIEDEERAGREKLQQNVLSLSPSAGTSLASRKVVREAKMKRPKLVILSRNGSRSISNEDLLVKMAEDIGFQVSVLRPDRTTELARIYRELNSSEVMIGVHGAAMTHFLFMRPGSVFIQVIPLGTEWAAEAYYGEPARKLGLRYIGYQILPRESSLYGKYDKNDPVLQDPDSVNQKGWQYTKAIYLESQNVRLNLRRFQKRLVYAFYYSVRKFDLHLHLQSR